MKRFQIQTQIIACANALLAGSDRSDDGREVLAARYLILAEAVLAGRRPEEADLQDLPLPAPSAEPAHRRIPDPEL